MKTYTSVQPEYSKNHTNDNNTDNTLQHKYHMMDINKCNPIGNYSNFFQWNATYQYEGIPENLFINSCGFIFLLFCFFFLRISAFNVANEETNKINLKATKKWKTLFFSINSKKEVNTRISSDTTIDTKHCEDTKEDDELEKHENVVMTSEINKTQDDQVAEKCQDEATTQFSAQISSYNLESRGSNMSFKSWLSSIFTLPDQRIIESSGNDALHYLRFQRHIICFLLIVTAISIGVILPINLQGTLEDLQLEQTTLANIDPNKPPYSHYLWAHVLIGFLFFPISILVMKRFSVDLHFSQYDLNANKTLMISKIPRKACHKKDELIQYFKEMFPNCEITSLQFAYDVQKLENIYQDLGKAKSALAYCEHKRESGVLDNSNSSPERRKPKICSCWCCCKGLPDVDFYEEMLRQRSEDFNRQKDVALQQPVGTVFISFKTNQMAKEVHDKFNRRIFSMWKPKLLKSSMDNYLRTKKWNVDYAPEEEDIYWETLSNTKGAKGYYYYKVKYVLVNIGLLLFLLFLSTPMEVLSQLQKIRPNNQNNTDVEAFLKLPTYIVHFFPTVMIWLFTILLPLIISWTDRYLVKHWTRSSENHDIMTKTFWYLIFMVIVLPTFGFTSFEAMVQSGATGEIPWKCIFPTDSGAFFVNYVITAGLAGSGMELIRLPELCWYAILVCFSRSKAELPFIQSTLAVCEFQFGEQYARMMMIFCMIMTYSIACPLITPFGTLYFVIKHYVDRHNLIYAYKFTKINKKIHITAINFFVLSTIFLQFFMMILVAIRTGSFAEFKFNLSSKSSISCLLFFLSVNIYSSSLWSETCKKLNPIEYIERSHIQENENEKIENPKIYTPVTLMTEDQKK